MQRLSSCTTFRRQFGRALCELLGNFLLDVVGSYVPSSFTHIYIYDCIIETEPTLSSWSSVSCPMRALAFGLWLAFAHGLLLCVYKPESRPYERRDHPHASISIVIAGAKMGVRWVERGGGEEGCGVCAVTRSHNVFNITRAICWATLSFYFHPFHRMVNVFAISPSSLKHSATKLGISLYFFPLFHPILIKAEGCWLNDIVIAPNKNECVCGHILGHVWKYL